AGAPRASFELLARAGPPHHRRATARDLGHALVALERCGVEIGARRLGFGPGPAQDAEATSGPHRLLPRLEAAFRVGPFRVAGSLPVGGEKCVGGWVVRPRTGSTT